MLFVLCCQTFIEKNRYLCNICVALCVCPSNGHVFIRFPFRGVLCMGTHAGICGVKSYAVSDEDLSELFFFISGMG